MVTRCGGFVLGSGGGGAAIRTSNTFNRTSGGWRSGLSGDASNAAPTATCNAMTTVNMRQLGRAGS